VRFAYFPGCVAYDSCRELDTATRAVASLLRIELVDLPDAGCCGAGNLQEYSAEAARAVNARTLAMAEAAGAGLLTVCGTCQMYLSRANQELQDPAVRERTNALLAPSGRRYGGGVKVKHLLQVLLEDVGPRKLAAHVRRPLQGLAVAAFYGCHILRAPGAAGNPEDPRSLEELIEVLGGVPTEFAGRTACCGFHILTVREDLPVRMAGTALAEAKGAGVQALATPCPLCHLVLDTYQGKSSKAAQAALGVPVLHLAQLVGLALGADPEALGLKRHLVSAKSVVRHVEEGVYVRA
jgi:succinate dehydrogenase / fumarate reductase cytochrome b subunit